MPIHRLALAAVTVALSALGAGCGGESAAPPQRTETPEPLPELPAGWRAYVNDDAGFAVGVPPGWSVERRRATTLLRPPDRLVAVSISADRTQEALSVPLPRYATEAASDLRGFEDLRVSAPRHFRARYPAVAVAARGRARESGVPQTLLFVVMRRDRLAAYPALIAANARRADAAQIARARRAIRTLRGRPVA